MVVFRLVGGEGLARYPPPVWSLPQWPRWMASVVTHNYSRTHSVCWANTLALQAADPFILCVCRKAALHCLSFCLFFRSRPLSYISVPVSLLLPLSFCPPLSVFLSLIVSLPLSHPLYISTHWEKKEDVASYLVCLPGCVRVWNVRFSRNTEITWSGIRVLCCYVVVVAPQLISDPIMAAHTYNNSDIQ